MWELDHQEGWVPKNWCFQIVVLEEPPVSPLDSKEINPVNPLGNRSWIFIAAAAKLLQSCPTLCNPIDGSPSGSPIPGILQAGTLAWVAISFSNARKWKVKVKSLSCVRLFATPWTAAYQAPPSMGFSRQEYWSGLSLEGLILKLKLQYFGHLIQTVDSLEKILMLGKIEGKKRKGQQRMRWLDSITASVNMNLSKLLEIVGDRWTWHAADHRLQRAGHDLATEQQQIHF